MEPYRKFPYRIEEKSTELAEKWKRLQSPKIILSETEPRIHRVSEYYADAAEAIYNFKIRPDDVWVVTFPKSGTTLTQEMVWLIISNDYETAKAVPLIKRFPFLEVNSLIPKEELANLRMKVSNDDEKLKNFLEAMGPAWEVFENWSTRRFIKTHLPFALLPPELLTTGCKVLYVARNLKDVAVSFFKFFFHDVPDEDFPEFWDLFQSDSLNFTPYWSHLEQGWSNRDKPNYCFLFYEDIIQDMKGTIRKVASFLEKDMTEEQVDRLAEHLNIKNLRANESVTRIYDYYRWGNEDRKLIRKGGIGGWRDYFTDELDAKANKWIEENLKKIPGFEFPVIAKK